MHATFVGHLGPQHGSSYSAQCSPGRDSPTHAHPLLVLPPLQLTNITINTNLTTTCANTPNCSLAYQPKLQPMNETQFQAFLQDLTDSVNSAAITSAVLNMVSGIVYTVRAGGAEGGGDHASGTWQHLWRRCCAGCKAAPALSHAYAEGAPVHAQA